MIPVNEHPSSSEVNLVIQSYDEKGNGVGSWTDPRGRSWSVTVPCAAVGERVRVELLRRRRRSYQARLLAVEEASKERVKPLCIHFGSCGGCRWQHVAYEEQLRIKEAYVNSCLSRFGIEPKHKHAIMPSETIWGYRNKMEFSFSQTADGTKRFLGLYLIGASHHVFNVQECHLVSPWFATALESVRHWWEETGLQAFHPPSARGSLRTLILREGKRSGDRLVMLTVSGNPEYALHQPQLRLLVERLKAAIQPQNPEQQLSIFLRIQQAIKGSETNFFEMLLHGPDHIRERLDIQVDSDLPLQSFDFQVSPSAFFQPHVEQAEKFFSRAFELAKLPKDGILFDLYCGAGTIGICASKQVKRVVGIEVSPEAALDARTNAANNGLENVTILSGDVGEQLPQVIANYPKPDLVVVDPPRTGLDDKVKATLVSLSPSKILYIACNPLRQAEDLAYLTQHGYSVTEYQPVDQFPHTPHIEAIAVLERIASLP